MSFCKWPDYECENYVEGNTNYCGTHNHQLRDEARKKLKGKKVYALPKATKPINKVSKKMKKDMTAYMAQKKEWIEGKVCAVFPTLMAQDVHHMKGKVGYADQWARENGYSLPRNEIIDESVG